MKADLIENLIIAHSTGDESKFKAAVEMLAADEEKKGNVPLATRIRNAYSTKKKQPSAASEFTQSSMTFSTQSFTTQSALPRDKDSLLELFEIMEPDVELKDVILPESQLEVIQQVINEQKNADKFLKHNLTPANRMLLCGPPGCGKTMTAYAIAHEMQIPVAYVRLDGLVSSYLGQTSTNLRKVFDAVRDKHIILFLDEFDAIAKKRDDSNELGELKRVVTTLLQNFDNMPPNVFLIAATNHEQLLDPAIWRRFNVTIQLDLPDLYNRKKLIEKWFQEFDISGKFNYKTLASISEGLSCANILEWAKACGKENVLKKDFKMEDATIILIRQLTKYSNNSEDTWKVILRMKKAGVSEKNISKAFGVPATTLNYQIKAHLNAGKEEEVNERSATESVDS